MRLRRITLNFLQKVFPQKKEKIVQVVTNYSVYFLQADDNFIVSEVRDESTGCC